LSQVCLIFVFFQSVVMITTTAARAMADALVAAGAWLPIDPERQLDGGAGIGYYSYIGGSQTHPYAGYAGDPMF
jgi:hypothetical protein